MKSAIAVFQGPNVYGSVSFKENTVKTPLDLLMTIFVGNTSPKNNLINLLKKNSVSVQEHKEINRLI